MAESWQGETIPDTEVIVGKGDDENEKIAIRRRPHQRTWPIRI